MVMLYDDNGGVPYSDYPYYGNGPQSDQPGSGAPPPGPMAPTPAPVPQPVYTGGGGGGGGAGLSPRPTFNFPGAPVFDAPKFERPSAEAALSDPGYQFRLGQGTDALQRSAAAKGLTRTGGTLRDLIQYGQDFASQEYGNVFNRALSSYDRQYQGAKDTYAPKLAEWQNLTQAELQAGMAGFGREWDLYSMAQHGGGHGPDIPPPPDMPVFE